MAIRLIAIDIDGTLLNSRGDIPDENRRAIEEAVHAGVEVLLVTGRAFHHAHPVAQALPDRIALIVSNGVLVKNSAGATLERRLLDRDAAREVISATRPVREGAAVIFDRTGDRQYLFENIDWRHPNRRRYYDCNHQFMTEVSPLEDGVTEDPAQVAFTGGVYDMRRLANYLRRQPIARALSITLTEYEARDFSLLDITTEGCSKGRTLSEWCTAQGIDAGEVMAVGDNLNDREMLEFAGVPVVMGNAVDELKLFGWHVTGGHDDAGLADAIRRLALSAKA